MKHVAVLAGLISTAWSSQLARSPSSESIRDEAPAAAVVPAGNVIPREQWARFVGRVEPRFVPQVEAGRVVALRLFLGPRSSLRELGFRGGEMLTAINGRTLKGDAGATATFERELAASSDSCSLSLTFQTNDQPQTVRAVCADRPNAILL